MIGIISIVIVAIFLFKKYIFNKESQTNNIINPDYKRLDLKNCRSIQYDLTKVIVKQHSWTERHDLGLQFSLSDNVSLIGVTAVLAKGFDSMSGRDTTKKVEYMYSLIEIDMPTEYVNLINSIQQNKDIEPLTSITKKIVLPFDEKTILIKFHLQKNAYFYVDKNNPDIVHFDFNFIN